MINPVASFRPFAGFCLLFAALLMLLGSAAGPSVHLSTLRAESAQAPGSERPEPAAPGSHHDQGCALCHSLAQSPLPGSRPAEPPVREVAGRAPAEPPPVTSSAPSPRAHARAPPRVVSEKSASV